MGDQRGRISGQLTGGNPGYPEGVRNGRIPLALLRRCETQTHAAHPLLYPPAARMWDCLVRGGRAQGVSVEAVALYRDYGGQQERAAYWAGQGKPGNAARPGFSSHGWATAADPDLELPNVRPYLLAHGAEYGWEQPRWADDGRGTEEDWHFQWRRGFEQTPAYLAALARWERPEVPVYVAGQLVPTADAYRAEAGVYVAVRPVVEALGWEVASLAVAAGEHYLHLLHPTATPVRVPVTLQDGRSFGPVRKLCRVLQVPCRWDPDAQTVRIG
jgi:hypothetical protein